MLDKLLTAIGITPAAAETQQAPNADAMISSLERMGIKRDDPMYGAYAELAKAFAGGKKQEPEMGLGAKAIASLGDTLGTGFLARAGVKVPLIFPGMLDSQEKERQRLEERAYQAQLGLLGSALPYKQKDVERQRREDTMRSVMEDRPGLAPGGAQGVQLPAPAGAVAPPPVAAPGAPPVGQRLPPGPTAAPMPVDRGALPPTGGEGLAPESEALTTPQPAPQMPMPTPQVAAPMQPIAPAAPAPSAPAGPAGPGSKYRLTPEEVEARFPMPHPQKRIDALIAGGYDKEADNLRQANELTLKRREQFIKMYEVGRSTDDPESTKAKESAKLDAKREGDIKTSQVDAARATQGITNSIKALDDLATSDKFTELAIGPFDTSKEGVLPWGFGPSGQTIASMLGRFHETGPDEVRSAIEQRARGIAASMKPFVRKPGEGAWSDKDQEALENMVGDLTKSRDATDLRRRVRNIHAMINDTFAKPLGVDMKGHGLQDIGGTASVLDGSDKKTKALADAGLTPEKTTEIQRRYQSADPAGKAAIEQSLREKNLDPQQVLGGTQPAAPRGQGKLNPDMGLNFVADRLRQPSGPTAPRRRMPSMLIDGESF